MISINQILYIVSIKSQFIVSYYSKNITFITIYVNERTLVEVNLVFIEINLSC